MKDHIDTHVDDRAAAPLIRRLSTMSPLSCNEIETLSQMPQQRLTLGRGRDIIKVNSKPAHAFVVLDGWVTRSILTLEGRRQIMNIAVPGDIVGLNALALGRSDYTASSMSRVTLGAIAASDLRDRFAWAAAKDNRHLQNQTIRLGRLSAQRRIAHLLSELRHRVETVGGVEDGWMAFPMTQTDLSDVLGLSLVHTNRQLQELRRQGVITLERDKLNIRDVEALRRIGEYVPA